MSFFTQFPKTSYSINNDGIKNQITDIYRYVDVIDKLATNVTAYSLIEIENGERPDNLSHRLYGTPDYYWTFMILNDQFKDGLTAWPKSYNEIRRKILNDFSDVGIFHTPYVDDTMGSAFAVSTNSALGVNGLSINKYKKYLKMAKIIGTQPESSAFYDNQLYVIADITFRDSAMNQLFVDKSTVRTYVPKGSESSVSNFAIQVLEQSGFLNTFNLDEGTTSAFRILFVNPHDSAHADFQSVETLRRAYLKEVEEWAVLSKQEPIQSYVLNNTGRGLANGTINTALGGSANHYDTELQIPVYRYHSDGKKAPHHYFNNATGEQITEFEIVKDAGFSAPFVTNEENMLTENENKTQIKYVLPSYIQSFAKEYRKLINE